MKENLSNISRWAYEGIEKVLNWDIKVSQKSLEYIMIINRFLMFTAPNGTLCIFSLMPKKLQADEW